MSIYKLPLLDVDPLANINGPTSPSPSPSVEQQPDEQPEMAEGDAPIPVDALLATLITKFYGLHHVESHYSGRGSSNESSSSRSSGGGVVHSFKNMVLPFSIGSCAIADPFWIVAPNPSTGEKGVLRTGIAVESLGQGSIRTRIQFYLRLDLNSLADSAICTEAGSVIGGPSGGSRISNGTDDGSNVHGQQGVTYPHLRGRCSSSREAVYFHDRLFVACGKNALLTVWSANDGLHGLSRYEP